MKRLFRFLLCHVLNDHEWTSKVMEEIKPKTPIVNIEKEFKEYCRMWCKHCGKYSKLSL